MPDQRQIFIHVGTGIGSSPELFQSLQDLLPVKFSFAQCKGIGGAAVIILEREDGRDMTSCVTNMPVLRVTAHECGLQDRTVELAVKFADDEDVPFPFRGRSLAGKCGSEPKVLALRSGEKALATTSNGVVWAVSLEGRTKHFRSGFALPRVPANGSLRDVLHGERFFEILPLLHFLHEVCASTLFTGPPLRAGFMIDDPNVHWFRYGHVDFREIAARAAKQQYHVSFATIPLDTWFIHQATAEVFRKNPRHISLLIHGNNHTYKELAGDYTEAERVHLLRQAVRRIERLERVADLRVSRVMAPPHGACSGSMLEELPKCGFEAATISHGSLRSFNKTEPWTRNLGYLPSEHIRGCPVLPRWGFTGNVRNTILLGAYLRQPIILMGHHRDLRDGIELLSELACFINGLGSVQWSNMSDLCAANYQWRRDGDTCRLRPLGRKISFRIPNQTARLILESPDSSFEGSWQIVGTTGAALTVGVGKEISLAEGFSGTISVEATTAPERATEHTARRPVAAAFVRRLLTEGRDRFLS